MSCLQKESAENIRKATASALDALGNTDIVTMREKTPGAMATSTPRSSDTERVFNVDSDSSHVICDSDRETPHDTSEDSHKSEICFNLNPMNIKMGTSAKAKDSVPKPVTGKQYLSHSSSNEESSEANDKKDKEAQNSTIQMNQPNSWESSQTTYSPNDSTEVTDTTSAHTSMDSSEPLVVNLGPKRENKEPYQRDFYINDTPKLARRTPPTSPRESTSMSPPVSPREVKQEQTRARTEEKVMILFIE